MTKSSYHTLCWWACVLSLRKAWTQLLVLSGGFLTTGSHLHSRSSGFRMMHTHSPSTHLITLGLSSVVSSYRTHAPQGLGEPDDHSKTGSVVSSRVFAKPHNQCVKRGPLVCGPHVQPLHTSTIYWLGSFSDYSLITDVQYITEFRFERLACARWTQKDEEVGIGVPYSQGTLEMNLVEHRGPHRASQ